MKILQLTSNGIILLIILFISIGCNRKENKKSQAFKVGVAVVDITPSIGYPVHGVPNEGVLDSVKIKTIVFNQNKKLAAIVLADLFFIDIDLSTEVRKKVSFATGIPYSNICVAATHTHNDPTYIYDCESYFNRKKIGSLSKEDEGGYVSQLITKMVQSVIQAKNNLRPVNINSGNINTEGIVFNRRFLMRDGSVKMNPGFLNPDIVRAVGPVDPEIGIILFRSLNDDKPLSAFVTFPMQVATVGNSTRLSAGYPFFIEKGLQNNFGDEFVSVFAEGPSGDVNHFDVQKPGPQTGYEEPTKTLGFNIANTILKNLEGLNMSKGDLDIISRTIQVPLQTFSSMDIEWAKNYNGEPAGTLIKARVKRILQLEKLHNLYGTIIPMEVQAFRINDETVIITLPGQPFVELGLALKEASPFTTTLIITLANSHEECIPIKKAYTEGSYEVIYSRVEAGGGEMLIETALELINKLKK